MRNRIVISAVIIGLFFALITIAHAKADVYVKVDANGNAIGGAIMCDAETCAEGSEYSRLTLNEGERYVLQGRGHAGIGNNNPNTQVKVDLATNEWTVTRQSEPQVIAQQTVQTTTVEKFDFIENRVSVNTEIKLIETQPIPKTPSNNVETSTAVVETSTAVVETSTAVINGEIALEDELLDINSPNWWKVLITWLNNYFRFDWWFIP